MFKLVLAFYFKIQNSLINRVNIINIYSGDEGFINYASSKIVDFSEKQKTIIVNRNLSIFKCLVKSNLIVDKDTISGIKKKILQLNPNNYFLSVNNDPWIAWNIADFLNKSTSGIIVRECSKSKDLLDKLIVNSDKKQKDKVVVIGTGPAISNIDFTLYNDHTSIVCNAFVKNKEAFNQLKPDFLVATDVAVYLGNSLTSRMFYLELNLRFQEFSFLFVYPSSLHWVVRKNVEKKYYKNLVPISKSSDQSFLTLVNEFKLNSIGNTLNTIMMPLACYISKEIYLAGFDGFVRSNKFEENSAIWKYEQNFSFGHNLIDLNKSEYSFQNFHKYMNDNGLYETEYFGAKLEKQLDEIEKLGYQVFNLTYSNHLALRKRSKKEDQT